MTGERWIAETAYALACSLPNSTVVAVAAAIRSCSDETLRSELAKKIAHHQHRDLVLTFVDRWQKEANDIDARSVALALQTAAFSEQTRRGSQSVELVWTGPDTGEIPFRRTEQAILQVLDGAETRITLVSFAVYRIPNVGKALVRAAKRGVRLTVVLETPDKVEGEGEYSTIQALGQEVAACASVYFWPTENRPIGDNHKTGLLHVKCAVADGEWLFLSSANLTRQAFTVNMELGMLVRGGMAPGRVEQQFERLIKTGQLKRI